MHITDPVGWWLVNVTHLLLTDSTLTQTPPFLPTSWPSRLSASRRSSWPTMRWTRLVIVYWCYSHLDIECLEWTNCAELHAQVPAKDPPGDDGQGQPCARLYYWPQRVQAQDLGLHTDCIHRCDCLPKSIGLLNMFNEIDSMNVF